MEGRSNNLKIVKFINLFIHKNFIFTFPQFIYAFFNFFSAKSIFDDYYLQLYNLIFTAFSISYVGTYDNDIKYLRVATDNRAKNREDIVLDESIFPCKKIETIPNLKNNF